MQNQVKLRDALNHRILWRNSWAFIHTEACLTIPPRQSINPGNRRNHANKIMPISLYTS